MNCGKSISDKYCSSCGQRTNVRDITIAGVYDDVKHGVLHLEHGLLYTLKELCLRPGTTVRAYVDGKRVRYYKPVAMVALLGGAYVLLDHMIPAASAAEELAPGDSGYLISKYYTLAHVLFIPVISACSYVVFRKWHESYARHFVLVAYLFAMKLALDIVALPAEKMAVTLEAQAYIASVNLLCLIVFIVVAYKQYLGNISTLGSIVRTMLVLFMALVAFIVAIVALEAH